MASKVTEQAAREETTMQMTPMIDVTFLLLIFFMCSIKFKLLDGKLAAYLPRDVGVNATPADEMLEKIDIDIKLSDSARHGFTMAINGKKMPTLSRFCDAVGDYRRKDPEAKATIYAHKGVQYGHVVKVVNECLRARMTQITFGGVALDE